MQTTERYLRCKEKFCETVNDRIGIEPTSRGSRAGLLFGPSVTGIPYQASEMSATFWFLDAASVGVKRECIAAPLWRCHRAQVVVEPVQNLLDKIQSGRDVFVTAIVEDVLLVPFRRAQCVKQW